MEGKNNNNKDRQTDREAGRQTDRQTGRQTDRQTGRQAETEIEKLELENFILQGL